MAEQERPIYELQVFAAKAGFLQVCDEKKWNTEAMFALQIIRGNELLQKANPESIKNAIVNIALTGATLNPAMAMAYLVPRSIRGKGMCCCLDFSYRGLIKIATDSGSVKHIASRIVYSFDTFSFTEEDGAVHVTYEPSMAPPPEFIKNPAATFWDHLVCGYVIVTLFDGTKVVYQPLPKWKLQKAMDVSKTSGADTPWRTHPDEMCIKTLIKYASKTLPHTDRMDYAVAILNEHEGMEVDTSEVQRRRGGSAAAAVQAMRAEAMEAEYSEAGGQAEEQGPAVCPSCFGLLIEGKCHSDTCDQGEPPPTN